VKSLHAKRRALTRKDHGLAADLYADAFAGPEAGTAAEPRAEHGAGVEVELDDLVVSVEVS
jgi:hypothetical protein